jgi:cation diffusion facilitator CzcD-associated flavoprotein CzcO
MASTADGDGYRGPAELTVAGADLPVAVEADLRGYFQPIDGRYHWHGRLAPSDALTAALASGRVAATLRTPHGSAPCEVGDPDPWQRYRVTGMSTPPFLAETNPAAVSAGPGRADRAADERGSSPADDLPAHVTVAIIGAGFGGLGAGLRLRARGLTDFVILERAGAVGGAWRDNTYPGCACDVPSHLYSYSFAPNPDWSRSFSPQPEIRRYLERVADSGQLRPHLRLGTELLTARWHPGTSRWQLQTSRGPLTATIIITAAGALSDPAIPDIPGRDSFPGAVFHSARWDHDTDLAGQRVAVVGTGASAIQLVPAIQPQVASLVLFQRTPAWVLPRRDRPVSAAERWLFRHVPATQKLARLALYAGREATVGAFTRQPAVLRAVQPLATRHLATAIADAGLRARLTPGYVLGCKRILLSSDYYPALARPNVRLIASGLARIDGSTLIAQDGSSAAADAIVFATGFHVTDMPVAGRIFAGDGGSLAEHWSGDMTALRGTTVAGFPNLCLVTGPNTGLGHTSMVHVIESQLNYIGDYVTAVARLPGAAALDARTQSQQHWNDRLQRRMERTVWATGGCQSWYLNATGRNPTLWPGSTLALRRATRHLDPAEYDVVPAGGPQ